MRKLLLTIFALSTLQVAWSQDRGHQGNSVPDTVASTEIMLSPRRLAEYGSLFSTRSGTMRTNYLSAASREDSDMIRVLGGNPDSIDTPLEIALLANTVGVINVRPVEVAERADAILPANNQRLVDLTLGANLFQENQVLRFLADTNAVGRYEGMLKFITDKGNVTRCEVESFYRNGISGLVSQLVDEQVSRSSARINSQTLSAIKNVITDFMLAPSRTTYNALLQAYRRYAGDGAIVLARTIMEVNYDIADALTSDRSLGHATVSGTTFP